MREREDERVRHVAQHRHDHVVHQRVSDERDDVRDVDDGEHLPLAVLVHHPADPRSREHAERGPGEQDGGDARHVEPEVVHQHPQAEREEDLLAGAVEQAQQVIVSILPPEHDALPPDRLGANLPVVHVREANDRHGGHEREHAAERECRAIP